MSSEHMSNSSERREYFSSSCCAMILPSSLLLCCSIISVTFKTGMSTWLDGATIIPACMCCCWLGNILNCNSNEQSPTIFCRSDITLLDDRVKFVDSSLGGSDRSVKTLPTKEAEFVETIWICSGEASFKYFPIASYEAPTRSYWIESQGCKS